MIKTLSYKTTAVCEVKIKDKNEHQQKFWMRGAFYELDLLNYLFEKYGTGLNIVDVGSCIGNHTLFFASVMQAQTVYAFDINKENNQHLKENIQLNNLCNVMQFSTGLAEKPGTVSYLSNPANVGMSKIVPKEFQSDLLSCAEVNYLDLFQIKADIIKIDVEGYELQVIEGASETIHKHSPVIIIEVQDKKEMFVKHMAKLDYVPVENGRVFCATPTMIFERKK